MTEVPARFGQEDELAALVEAEANRLFLRHDTTSERLARDIREILDYIHEHISDETLSVKTVRRSCGIGNHNISSRFQLAVGISIGDYIKTLRMEIGARLLRRPDLPIYWIGSLLGYSHQESFTRTFRRYFGCCPSVYRRDLLGKNGHGRPGGPAETDA